MIFFKTKNFPIWIPARTALAFPDFKNGVQIKIHGKVYTEDNEEFRKALEAESIWGRLADE